MSIPKWNAPPIENAANVADAWERYGGENKWTLAMRRFGELGGLSQYWCGMPRCASAIPLTFALFDPQGNKLDCSYRLRDITEAIALLESRRAFENFVNVIEQLEKVVANENR